MDGRDGGGLTTTELLPFIQCLAPPRLVLFRPGSPESTTVNIAAVGANGIRSLRCSPSCGIGYVRKRRKESKMNGRNLERKKQN
ncbi:hypothetical protein PIB30_057980 [Stylosanthes scabra]|uniref:Uncharacterized protein n=1 Tax=Stylosanthes scabra TaxID=79078 RepID=A0ABU6TLY2_9FABA|nr:hypothetical protein [Stylosanthes scabra]